MEKLFSAHTFRGVVVVVAVIFPVALFGNEVLIHFGLVFFFSLFEATIALR